MMTYGASGGTAQTLLTSALDRGKLAAARSSGFTPGERAHGTHWIGD
jgi:hypothetical protein